MIRNLKALGLIVVSILALSALAAPAVQAKEFTAPEYPATVQGQAVPAKDYVYIFGPTKVTCKHVDMLEFLIVSTGVMTQIVVSSSECTATIGGTTLPGLLVMNGCDWDYNIPLQTKVVVCPPGKKVFFAIFPSKEAEEKEAPLCTFEVGPQSMGKVEYENKSEGSVEEVIAKENLTGVAYTRSGSILCGPKSGSSEWTGETTFSATNEAEKPINFMVG